MPVYISCPHCQATLLLPEDCGGQTTKCPSCADDFVIPGSGAATSPMPIAIVRAAVEGTVSEADLKRTQEAFERLTSQNVGLQVELARRKRRCRSLASRLQWLKRFRAGRQKLDHTVGRGGGFFLAVTLGAAAALVLFSVFPLSAFGFFCVGVMGLLAAGTAYMPFSYYPDDVKLALTIPKVAESIAEAQRLHDLLAAEEARHREKLAAAEVEYQRVKTALHSRLHWLRHCQWQQMTSKNFVNFLKQVFEEHGYTVEPTGKMGPVGIDLVVARGNVRVAIQAKGVAQGPVDNQVVQQTHAGMARHRCQAAAVITNTQFMPSARQLAERLGCKLIDGSQIPDLIEGRIGV